MNDRSGLAELGFIFIGTLVLIVAAVKFGPWLAANIWLALGGLLGAFLLGCAGIGAWLFVMDRPQRAPEGDWALSPEQIAAQEYFARRAVEPEAEEQLAPAAPGSGRQVPDWSPLLKD